MANQRNGGNDAPESEGVATDLPMQDIDAEAESNHEKYGTLDGPQCTGHPDIFRVIWKVPGIMRNNLSKVNSPTFEISNTKWTVLLQLKEESEERINRLGAFLDSSPMTNDLPDFKVEAVFELAAENKDPLLSENRALYHTFCKESADWGFRELVKKESLLDPNEGFLTNDTLLIKITVRVLKESEVREYLMRKQTDMWLHDPKTETGYVGLKNQGATCYMNSLLQSLYHVPALQRAVYKMPTEQETSVKRQRTATQHPAVITRQDNSNTQESVALALQRVFYHLQHSSKSVGTKQLTKSFGWDALDAFTQHDVQELDRVLCDNLEEKMKGTPVEKEVPRLFRGKLKNFVKCKEVDFSSERVEDFYDLSLNVRGCKNLKESLEKYVEKETLDGDNKYMADGHGLQDAVKGCTFSSFPPVLHLHLKRFEYDPLRDANVKINDRFEFDETIDLAPYMEETPGGPEIYQLHSVLVHSGDVHGGHYYAYIRPDCSDKWFKFNDESVKASSREEAIEANFGCDDDSQVQTIIARNRIAPRRFSNAYMIVYVKQEAVKDVLRPLINEDIPDHLRHRFKIEEEEEELRRKEKSEAHLKLTLKVATWKHLEHFDAADLHDWQNVLMLQVNKTMTFDQLKKTIRETADVQAEDLRIWPCCKRKNETVRTQSPTRMAGDTALKDLRGFSNMNDSVIKIFVEQLKPGDMPNDKIDDKDALIFFKFWDPKQKSLRHIGHHIFKPTTRVRAMVEEARSQFLPHLQIDDIDAFEELKPDKIENLIYCVQDERGNERDALLQDKQVELQSGDIIVIQPTGLTVDDCVKQHYDYLHCKISVSFRAKATPDKEAFETDIHSSHDYAQVCSIIADKLNTLGLNEQSSDGKKMPADGKKMQLIKQSHKDGPQSSPAERKPDWVLRDMFPNNNYANDKYIVYYEELWYSVEDLEMKMLLRFKLVRSGKGSTQEVLVDKGPTAVEETLAAARTYFSADESPPELFLCNVRQGKITKNFCVSDEEDNQDELMKASENLSLHVIGVSAKGGGVEGGYIGGFDSMDEHSRRGWLLKVTHFEMDAKWMRERNTSQAGSTQSSPSARHYGNPLLVRVTADETVADLKRKVRDALEEQSKKSKDAESNEPNITDWALWLFSNQPMEELTDDEKTLDEAKVTDSDCHIGVEHPDKYRYANTMRTVEKSIKISR